MPSYRRLDVMGEEAERSAPADLPGIRNASADGGSRAALAFMHACRASVQEVTADVIESTPR